MKSKLLLSFVLLALAQLTFAAAQVQIPVRGGEIRPGDTFKVDVKPYLFPEVSYNLTCHVSTYWVNENSYIKVSGVAGSDKLTIDGENSSSNQFKITKKDTIIENQHIVIPKKSQQKYYLSVQNLNPSEAIYLLDCTAFPSA